MKRFLRWLKRYYDLIILGIGTLAFIGVLTQQVLFSYRKVDELEYFNVDFEWVDDFGNYEVVVVHNDKPHYLTIKDNKVRFIYADEEVLNFVIVNYSERIVDKKERYYIERFYINIKYKEIEDDE